MANVRLLKVTLWLNSAFDCELMIATASGFLLFTSGVRIDPRSGTVDLQRTAIEHLGETCSHLRMGEETSEDT